MSKVSLLFTLKCAVILYFAACTNIDKYGVTQSTTPIVTQGKWKVDLYTDLQNDKTNDLEGYVFSFANSGEVIASKDGIVIKGRWAEDNDSKGLTLDLDTEDPLLSKLNTYWNIRSASGRQVDFQNSNEDENIKLNITSL